MTDATTEIPADAVEILGSLCRMPLPDYELSVLQRVHSRLQLRISKVLEDVPGKTVAEKARIMRTTRQTIYSWRDGVTRPRGKEARRLAKITGYSVEAITGDVGESRAA